MSPGFPGALRSIWIEGGLSQGPPFSFEGVTVCRDVSIASGTGVSRLDRPFVRLRCSVKPPIGAQSLV